ncbi:MAG TPA: phage tail tape measure protein [Candidatus Lumbricidophila sp.]|nr:phage tail tape measure protein [Candidatus Lumbricidophila sp.]
MVDRVVKISLTAQVNNYLAGMEQVRQANSKTASEAEKLKQKLEEQKQAFNLIGGAMLSVGAVAAAAVGTAVKKWADFDQAMANVAAATHESDENMQKLRDAALEAGARTVFSATEAANAVEELGKAGVSTADILNGGLDGALSLASAGGLGVADAAGIAAVALKTFGLRGSDMTHVADLLAAGAGKAMGSVSDLSMALSQSGQVAHATGLTLDETTAGLAAFASNGLLGSDAGTSFKSMLQRLTPQSAQAAKAMSDLGISAYDSQGNFVGLANFAENLHDKLKDLTVEQRQSTLATIFGSDAVRAATVLYNQGGQGIADWENKVNDAGYAADTAAKRLDNLKGDLEQLGGALDTALIKAGSAADGPLRFLTQTATDMVSAFAAAPTPVQQTALAVAAVAAAVLLAGGGFLVAVPKVAEFNAALATMGPLAQRTAGLVNKAFKALGVVGGITVALDLLNQWAQSTRATSAELVHLAAASDSAQQKLTTISSKGAVPWLVDVKVGVDDVRGALDQVKKASDNWLDGLSVSLGQTDIMHALRDYGKGLGDLAATNLPAAQRAFRQLSDEYHLTAEQQMTALNEMDDYRTVLINASGGALDAADKQGILKKALGDTQAPAADTTEQIDRMADASKAAADDVDAFTEAIKGMTSANLDARETARGFQEALDSFDKTVQENGRTLDIHTAAGRANEAALDAIAKAAIDNSVAIEKQTGNELLSKAALEDGRKALLDKLAAFGITGAAAQAYIDKLVQIPHDISTNVSLNTGNAQAAFDRFITDNNGRKIQMQVIGAGFAHANGAVVDYYAAGGLRERHVAQIAPAGAWRVWAEPETGGEAYIPLSPAKRARSLDIWQETGRRLGVQGFADGGIRPQYAQQPLVVNMPGSAAVTQRAGATVNIYNPVAVDPLRAAQEAADYIEAGQNV